MLNLILRYRREVKHNLNGEDEEDPKDEKELIQKYRSEKTKSNYKSKQIQASFA